MYFFEADNSIILNTDFSGKLITISKNIEKITGYISENFIQKYIWELFEQNNLYKDIKSFENNFFHIKEYFIKDKYGEYKYFKPVTIFYIDKLKFFIFYNITDFKIELEKFKNDLKSKTEELTNINSELVEINSLLIKEIYERKQIEEKLSYNYYLLDNIKDAIIATANDKNRTIVLWNKGAELIFDINKEKAIGVPLEKLLSFDFPTESDKQKYSQLMNNGYFKGEMIFSKKCKKKKKIFLDVNIIPIMDKEKKITEWIGVYRDITERKEFEIKEKLREEQLIKSEKLASLGFLISGIAHEINNPNNYVKLNSKMLRKFYEEIKPILDQYFNKKKDMMLLNMPYNEAIDNIQEVIQGLNDGATRISNIIQSLKEFVQPDQGLWNQDVDVNNALKAAIVILNNLIKNSTNNFVVTYDYSIPIIKGNRQQLEQVLINLIVNACQSLKTKEDSIFVSTKFDNELNLILINIKDQGVGMPKEVLSKIIEPFFTTKIESGGTGLGLSISYNIIRKFKGDISFFSEENKGTTVTIKIPVLVYE